MDIETLEAARSLVDYTIENERKHWEEAGRPVAHVYMDARKLEACLDAE